MAKHENLHMIYRHKILITLAFIACTPGVIKSMDPPPNRASNKRAFPNETEEYKKKLKEDINARLADLHSEFYANFGQNTKLFFESAARGDTAAFIEAFAKINEPFIMTKKERTVLHIAARYGHLAIVNIILHAYPNFPINAPDCLGRTALSWALESGNVTLACKLHMHGGITKFTRYPAFPHITPAHYAAAEGHADMIPFLIETLKMPLDVQDHRDATPLEYACQRGHLEVARRLLGFGASPTHRGNGGMTALHWAAESGNAAIICQLIANGADVSARSAHQETPAHIAALHNHHHVVRLLHDFGADVSARAQSYTTPLHKAIINDRQETIRELIELGAETISPNNQESYLSLALRRKKNAAVRELLRCGIPLQKDDESSIREAFESHPLLLAAVYGECDKLQILIISSTQEELHEALVFAASQGQKKAVLELLKYGAHYGNAFHSVSHILDRTHLASNMKETYEQIQSILGQQSLTVRTIHYISQNLNIIRGYEDLPPELKMRVLATAYQKLEKAVRTGDEELLTQAIDEGADPFTEIPRRLPFIIQAACFRDQNRAYALIKLFLDRITPRHLPSHIVPWLEYLKTRQQIYNLLAQRIAP